MIYMLIKNYNLYVDKKINIYNLYVDKKINLYNLYVDKKINVKKGFGYYYTFTVLKQNLAKFTNI